MKKLFLSLVLISFGLLSISQTYDVTISGTVTDLTTGNPVIGHEVHIATDSITGSGYFHFNTVLTDDSGAYMDIMQVPNNEQGVVDVSTYGCGTLMSQMGSFSQNATQLVFDFQICNDTSSGCQAMYSYFPVGDSLDIQFIDESTGNPSSWLWEFGDGTTSTEQNPLHSYSVMGTYNTSLTISGSGCTSIIEMIVFVMNDTLPGGGCEAMYYYYPGNLQNTIQFVDESYGNPNNWTWSFGDGTASYDQNPEHTYSAPGEYLVTLQIEGDSNCFSLYEDIVYVGDSIWPQDCQAMYYYYPDSVNHLTVNFIDISFVGGNPNGTSGNPETWDWDFGDNNISSEQNPTHTYQTEGEYQVCLTITDSTGTCVSTYCDIVFVDEWNNECEAYFWYYPMGDTNNTGGTWNSQNISFIDASFGNPDSWLWNFGDGTTSTEQNPIHYFEEEGIYNVCLSISNSMDSCQSDYCEEIYVFNDTTMGCFAWYDYQTNNLTVDFTAYLDGGSDNVDYMWNFGDGTTGSGAYITHTFAQDGIYEVLLSASDSSGCYSEYIEMIWVGDSITFGVSGYVHLQDSVAADYADVYLMTFDTMGNGLINLATTQTTYNGYYQFEGVGMENCVYFVQAELTTSSAYYGTYLPTYHLDATNWEMAMPIFPFPTGWSSDIYMAPVFSSSTGNGVITGVVNNQGFREVMSNVEIILLDHLGNPVAYLRTDDAGIFSFNGLANGTYTVYTELVGIETIPFDVTISDESPSSSVSIVVNNGQAILGVGDIQSKYIQTVEDIYPNPVTDNSAINISVIESSNVRIEILNQYGQVIYSNNHSVSSGKHRLEIPNLSIAQGYYFVKITAEDNISNIRKFVKLR